jgi:hypothetical protein
MRALTATGLVHADHTLTVQVPADISPGPKIVVMVLEDQPHVRPIGVPLHFNPHPVGPADPTATYRREDIYGDDGR